MTSRRVFYESFTGPLTVSAFTLVTARPTPHRHRGQGTDESFSFSGDASHRMRTRKAKSVIHIPQRATSHAHLRTTLPRASRHIESESWRRTRGPPRRVPTMWPSCPLCAFVCMVEQAAAAAGRTTRGHLERWRSNLQHRLPAHLLKHPLALCEQGFCKSGAQLGDSGGDLGWEAFERIWRQDGSGSLHLGWDEMGMGMGI